MEEIIIEQQVDRLVECLERVTLALQSIDLTLEKFAAAKKDSTLPSVDGE